MKIFWLILAVIAGAFFLSACAENEEPAGGHAVDSAIADMDIPERTAESEASDAPVTMPDSHLVLRPHAIALQSGERFTLNLAEGFSVAVAAEGLKRVRFMAASPDNRLFVTDMYNRTDNKRGKVYILEDVDTATHRFRQMTTYLEGLHNPNSVAFHTDATGKRWIYIALTGQLLRYAYTQGDVAPAGKPEVLATFPDYGLSYKYGGWHLTRTLAFGNNGKLYIAVGSSCNACVEKEEVRAAIVEMNPDGTAQRIFARGLRNAVGLRWVAGKLYATNMGSDHLGDNKPEDMFYHIAEGANYGWPYCYQYQKKVYADPGFDTAAGKVSAESVPLAFTGFSPHSSPLGFFYFGTEWGSALQNSFLVALHGSSKKSLNHGYCLMRVAPDGSQEKFMTGFLEGTTIHGRPCDVFPIGTDGFLVTDDHAGVIYYVYKTGTVSA